MGSLGTAAAGDGNVSGLGVTGSAGQGVGSEIAVRWFRDADGDGHGDSRTSMVSVRRPTGYVADSWDCDDDDPTIYSGATENVETVSTKITMASILTVSEQF
jgi:hypothetical protein